MAARDREIKENEGDNWGRCKWRLTDEAIELMDSTIIDNINRLVMPDDTLWICGDFAFGRRDYVRDCRGYRDRINCQYVNLVWGNHDRRHKIADLFHRTYDQVMIELPGMDLRAILNHFALAIWDGSHRGNIHLYGHSHSKAEPALDAKMPGRRSMDVGVDNAYQLLDEFRPFSLDEVAKRMLARTGYALDFHGQE